MKRFLAVCLASLMVFSMAGCSSDTTKDAVPSPTMQVEEPATEAPASEEVASEEPATEAPASEEVASEEPVAETPANPNLLVDGDLEVEYVSATLGKDYKDRDCVILGFNFTNKGTEGKDFIFSFKATAYQNGIELTDGMMVEGADSELVMKKIKDGVTLQVFKAFVLEDMTTDVELELDKVLSLDDASKIKITVPVPQQ